MTGAEAMARAIESIDLNQLEEWTMEANPTSINETDPTHYRSLGINRVSLGIQSLDDASLKLLGRVHASRDALCALESILKSFNNVSVDVMCGIPGQNIRVLENTLAQLMTYPLSHISCYLLTLPPHHRLFNQLPDENAQQEQLLFVHNYLTAHGFTHYEISNFAKSSRSMHNSAIWRGECYRGFGPAAHSYDGAHRWRNTASLKSYIQKISQKITPIEESEILTPPQKQLEQWMLGLRLIDDGFPELWLTEVHKKERLIQAGYLEVHPTKPGFMRLTPVGCTLSDSIILELAHTP